MALIRRATEEDAENLLKLNKRLDSESSFMLFEPDERATTVEQTCSMIRTIIHSENSILLVAEDRQHGLVGHLTAIGGNVSRIKHRAYVVIGILKDFTGMGIGTELFQELEAWRITANISRLELTVMVHNERAVHLYKKMGFAIEGVKKNSMFINGKSVDEYYMGKVTI